ncbi:TPA: ArsR family transcriptional regulator, partial [Candidatus Micrarchaeota archaeon]|nr:ArsR family transcriptional regulator [Candidatus Micrarchaeota archaeon]
MGKTGDTKKRIYEMLEQRNKTLTDISNELGLAPSTVSQHLREMLDSGAIRFVEDRPRKWKYYEINRGYQIGSGYMQANNSQSRFDFRKIGVPVAVIAAVLVSVFAFYMVAGIAYANAQQVYLAPGSSVPSGSTVFSVSDAPSFYNI